MQKNLRQRLVYSVPICDYHLEPSQVASRRGSPDTPERPGDPAQIQ